jgi:hypothetical protein
MAFTLCLNSSNVVSGSNNTSFKYTFLGGNFTAKNYEVCLGSVTIPYAWYNISSYYANNTFSITFPTTASLTTTVNVTLPDGFYSVVDIQNYIQQICIQNGFYLIDGAGNYVFYTYLTYSPTYYKVQLVQTVVPNSLPAGFTTPSNWQGFNALARTPTLALAVSGSIAPIIGFAPNTSYPAVPSATSVNFLSTSTPVGSTVNSLVVRCSLVSNNVVVPSDIMDGFAISNATFGSNIVYDPTFEKWVAMKDGVYNSLTITFVDQNLNSFSSVDPNVAITLLIRERR